jgi:CheY-like chemotaxis protein
MQIRARDRKIPLVALSAHAFVRPPNLEDKVFNAFLSKPVLLESLESCINNLKVQ